MKKQITFFITRWLLNSLGLWVAVRLLGTGYDNVEVTTGFFGFLIAGLIFSIVNSVFRPFVVIVSLPLILLTLGLFMIVVNGLMVYISLKLAPGITMDFFNSILTGIILGLVNYIVSAVLIIRTNSIR